jgi:Fe2+ transport system protein FeoA
MPPELIERTPVRAADEAAPPSEELICLSRVPRGARVRVRRVEGGAGLRARLSAMGLVAGTPAEVVCNGGGPIVLAVFESRVMIGRGMAAKVWVRRD